MTTPWLLDPPARLAPQDDEDGAERVAQSLGSAQAVQAAAWGCMSRMEVLYRVWKDEGERNARLAVVTGGDRWWH